MQLQSTNLQLYPKSMLNCQDVEYGMAHSPSGARLAMLAHRHSKVLEAFEGEISEFNDRSLLICPLTPHNANSLRIQLPWLQPKVIGLNTSVGMGDRLGLATPGHVRAVCQANGRIYSTCLNCQR